MCVCVHMCGHVVWVSGGEGEGDVRLSSSHTRRGEKDAMVLSLPQ